MRGDSRVVFGEWLPDLEALVNPGLTVASGAIPTKDGYRPFPTWATLGQGSLTDFARGALAGLDTAGVGYNFAGDDIALYRIGPAGFQNVTRALGPYNATGEARWQFLQFRNQIIAVNPFDDAQVFSMSNVNGLFSQLSPQAPRARYLAFIGPQLVFANLFDPQIGVAPDAFRYPSITDFTSWPDPASSDLAIASQAGRTIIQGAGGRIHAATSGAEVGAIFQERQISRVEYVGGDVIYQVDRVETTRGLLIPGLAIPFGRQILYCSDDGFYLFDYTSSTPIGDGKVNQFFLNDIVEAHFERVSWAIVPNRPLILIGYPGAGSVGGNPNRILCWNYVIDQWCTIEFLHDLLCRVLPIGVTMDNLGFANLDTVPMSLDSFNELPGAQTIGAYDPTHTLGTFSGPSFAATFETGDQEHNPGFLSYVDVAEPLVDDAEPQLQVSGALDRRSSSTPNYRNPTRMNRAGKCPVGVEARYHRYRLTLDAGWAGKAVGLDPEFYKTGRQ